MRQLYRVLRLAGLRRHSTATSKQRAFQTILRILNESGQYLGYRSMTRRLASSHGIVVSRETVRSMLLSIDPEGVMLRRNRVINRRSYFNKGPNFLIHIDGYDKLKRFGFPIHAAIDGFSRRLLWLEAVISNNNPRIVATLFLQYIREIEGVPRCLRMDAGTENTLTEDIQKAFRYDHNDDMAGSRSVIKGSSHSNQRIERWWRSGRQGCFQYWINIFTDMEISGYLSTSDPGHIECMRFCFWELLKTDLQKLKTEWNQHYIRKCHGTDSISGKPDILYYMPQLFETHEYKTGIDERDVDEVENMYAIQNFRGCSDWFKTEMLHRGVQMPTTVEEAQLLFRQLTSMLNQ